MAFPTSVNDIALGPNELSTDLGPLLGNAIHKEREKNGPFKNGADLAARVGLAPALVSKLESHGVLNDIYYQSGVDMASTFSGNSAVMNVNATVPKK